MNYLLFAICWNQITLDNSCFDKAEIAYGSLVALNLGT
jgi:hypothetical protein